MKIILNLIQSTIKKLINIGKIVCRKESLIRISILFILFFLIGPVMFFVSQKHKYNKAIYTNIDDVPSKRVAVVFGAGLVSENVPSDILEDRILIAVELYKAEKIEKIIMSGDNSIKEYDEPSVMIEYALLNGVEEEDLQPDYAGRRTYDTCYRAKHIFSLEDAILITQRFHLTRALYTCNSLGIESIGLASDLHEYQGMDYMQTRDIYALALAFIDIEFRKPEVILGEKIEI